MGIDILLEAVLPFFGGRIFRGKGDVMMLINHGMNPVFTSCFFFDDCMTKMNEFSEMLNIFSWYV